MNIRDSVTCQSCRDRLAECPTNEHGFPLAYHLFDVWMMSKAEMGHQLYWSSTGRVALCVAERLTDDKG